MYNSFAEVYDLFMEQVPYGKWCDFLCRKLAGNGITEGTLCELGCGTGSMTELLAARGFSVIGIDGSEEMLNEAVRKKDLSGREILYLRQDMRDFALHGPVSAIVSVCDCLNYLLSEEELLQTFRCVRNYLSPEGVFFFDMNTQARYAGTGDRTIAESREEGSFIWENTYDPLTGENEYALTLFVPEGDTGLYRRSEEVHVQKAYPEETIRALLEEAGLSAAGVWADYTDAAPDRDTERICVLAKAAGPA